MEFVYDLANNELKNSTPTIKGSSVRPGNGSEPGCGDSTLYILF